MLYYVTLCHVQSYRVYLLNHIILNHILLYYFLFNSVYYLHVLLTSLLLLIQSIL